MCLLKFCSAAPCLSQTVGQTGTTGPKGEVKNDGGEAPIFMRCLPDAGTVCAKGLRVYCDPGILVRGDRLRRAASTCGCGPWPEQGSVQI